MSQIATTAAGVAAGHVVGRMITGMFTGNGDGPAQSVEQSSVAMPPSTINERNVSPQCQEYSKLFLKCMEQNDNQVNTCQDYMDMMRACQQQQHA